MSNRFSTYSWGRITTPPVANVYPALTFTMKLGSTLIDLLKSSNPVPYVASGAFFFVSPLPLISVADSYNPLLEDTTLATPGSRWSWSQPQQPCGGPHSPDTPGAALS